MTRRDGPSPAVGALLVRCVDCRTALPWGDPPRQVGEIAPLCDDCAHRRDSWGITFTTMFDMSGDSDLFLGDSDLEALGGVRDGQRYVVPTHPDELYGELAHGVWERAVVIAGVRGVGSIRAIADATGALVVEVRDLHGEPAPQLAAAVKVALDGWERARVRTRRQDPVTTLPLFGDAA